MKLNSFNQPVAAVLERVVLYVQYPWGGGLSASCDFKPRPWFIVQSSNHLSVEGFATRVKIDTLLSMIESSNQRANQGIKVATEP